MISLLSVLNQFVRISAQSYKLIDVSTYNDRINSSKYFVFKLKMY